MSKIRVLPDFELLCEVISQCLGNSPNAFLEAWTSNRDEQVNQGLDSSIVAIVLEDYVREECLLKMGKNLDNKTNSKDKYKISEAPVEFFKTQLEHGKAMGLIKEDDKRFPLNPKIYGRELNRLKESLKHIGIKISTGTEHERRLRIVDYTDYRDRHLAKEPPKKDNTLDDTLDNNNSINVNTANTKNEIYECYYCDSYATKIEPEYRKHVLIKHPNGLCFPNYPEIVRRGLKPQGKPWEGAPPPNPIAS